MKNFKKLKTIEKIRTIDSLNELTNFLKETNEKDLQNIDEIKIKDLRYILFKVQTGNFMDCNYNTFMNFYSSFKIHFSKDIIKSLVYSLGHYNFTSQNIISFVESEIDILDEESLISLLRHKENIYSFFDLLDICFYKLHNNKKSVFNIINHDIKICDNLKFVNFISKNFDPNNPEFIDLLDKYFKLEEKNNEVVEALLKEMRQYYNDNSYVRAFIDSSALNNKLDIMTVIYTFRPDKITLKNFLRREEQYYPYHFYMLVEAVLKVDNSVEMIEFIINILDEIHFSTEDFLETIRKMNELDLEVTNSIYEKLLPKVYEMSARDIYEFMSITHIVTDDFIFRIIESEDPETIYKTSLLIKSNNLNVSKNLVMDLKNILKKTHNDYYILLYGMNVDSSILVECYSDPLLILSLVFLVQNKEKEDDLRKEINCKITNYRDKTKKLINYENR